MPANCSAPSGTKTFWRLKNSIGSRSQNEETGDEIRGLGGAAKGSSICTYALPFVSDIPRSEAYLQDILTSISCLLNPDEPEFVKKF